MQLSGMSLSLMTPVFFSCLCFQSLSLVSLSQGLPQLPQHGWFGPDDSWPPRLPVHHRLGLPCWWTSRWDVFTAVKGKEAGGGGRGEGERRQPEHPRVWAGAPHRHGSPVHPQLLLTLAFQPCSACWGFVPWRQYQPPPA